MIPHRSVFVPVLLVLAATGCRTVIVDSTRDGTTSRPAKDPDARVEVFKREIPERPHKVVGSVRAKVKLSPYRKDTWPDERVLEKMKKKARMLGADALVDLRVEQVAGGSTTVGPDGTIMPGDSQIWIALAVVWIDEQGT